jgi:hypothetical protein
MASLWPRNRLTELLAIDYPIVQGPLGGLSSQRLTAAVASDRMAPTRCRPMRSAASSAQSGR